MSDNIKRKPVAFNLDDPAQSEMYEYVMSKTKNFSNYIKMLIALDMKGQLGQGAPPMTEKVAKKEPQVVSDLIDDDTVKIIKKKSSFTLK